jgi:hypothetical protein
MRFLLLLAVLSFVVWIAQKRTKSSNQLHTQPSEQLIDTLIPSHAIQMAGLTMVAPPEPFPSDPYAHIQAVSANWVAVVPYAFTPPDKPYVRYNVKGMQWWGETPSGVVETIKLAREAGVSVMLKPQVYIPGAWTGNLSFEREADWSSWESDYDAYILQMAQIAEDEKVALFCIGTEFRASIAARPQYWSSLITKIKGIYHGKLTYSANWDDWEAVPFYGDLDYIGMSAYFPLAEGKTPHIDSLMSAWQPIAQRISEYAESQKKPVLFTECGYLSVDGCGWRNWELESKIDQLDINQEAQSNCYAALFGTFSKYDWWHGAFIWKWFPNMRGHEGYPDKDYTPQGKFAEKELKRWYSFQK